MTTSQAPDLFTLSTQVAPPARFTIDGESYILKDLRHLNDTEEAHLRTLMQRQSLLSARMTEAVSKGSKGEKLAEMFAMRERQNRMRIICHMTNAPTEVVDKLTLPDQVKLINYIADLDPGLRKDVESSSSDDIPDIPEDMEDDLPVIPREDVG